MRNPFKLCSIFLASSVRDDIIKSPSSFSSFSSLTSTFDGAYERLESARIYKDYTPSIKFSFVEPPSSSFSSSSSTTTGEFSTFESVTSEYGSHDKKPIALYLPGLDCFGISGQQQFEDLSDRFELWRMTVTTDDRTSFGDLANTVTSFVQDVSLGGKREVILIGESFGGQLAPVVALKLKSRNIPVKGMVLVNPATSFDNTNWDQLGPLLASLQRFQPGQQRGATPYTVVGGLTLSSLIPDSTQFQAIVDVILGVPVQSTTDVQEIFQTMNDGFGILGTRLPPEVIGHRVGRWLPVGAQLLTDKRLSSLDVPTLVVAGEDDKFLPSKDEARRLTKLLPNSETLSVKGSGHFVLDDRINLTEAILYSEIDPFDFKSGPKYDPILDWSVPEKEEIQATIDTSVESLRRFTSPVFFSTDENGKRHMGLAKLPQESNMNPIIFVSNHQLFGLDLGMIIAQLVEDCGIWARGLAHPVVFSDKVKLRGQPEKPGIVNPPETNARGGQFGQFEKFGAVKVTPRNYYRLLQTGQNVLLFPGGVREVFHGKDEAYKLFWPETPDFVRTAARFNATIIPISSVGSADSVNIVMDSPDIVNLPFGIGERILEQSKNTISARFNQENEEELFVPPFFTPKATLPARHYFCFGKPFSTSDINPKNLEQCSTLYQQVQQELERGFDDILRSREVDPYKSNLQRLAYERVTGNSAPTFSLDEMNKSL